MGFFFLGLIRSTSTKENSIHKIIKASYSQRFPRKSIVLPITIIFKIFIFTVLTLACLRSGLWTTVSLAKWSDGNCHNWSHPRHAWDLPTHQAPLSGFHLFWPHSSWHNCTNLIEAESEARAAFEFAPGHQAGKTQEQGQDGRLTSGVSRSDLCCRSHDIISPRLS